VRSTEGSPVSTAGSAHLAGRLIVTPGRPAPIGGGRPVVSAAVMQRLTEGVAAEALPSRLALLFSLCGTAHRLTARRAVLAAMCDAGADQPAEASGRAAWSAEDQLLALWTAREHLQRIALDLPQRLPVAGVPLDAGWLRGHPLATLPADAETVDPRLLQAWQRELRPWLEAAVLGGPAADWSRAWADGAADDGDSGALQQWSARRDQPAQRWLHGAGPAGRALPLPCRALPATAVDAVSLRALAATLDADPGFPLRPTWLGLPAETGCWTRVKRPASAPWPHNAWMRWQYRLAELIALARADAPAPLSSGMLALGAGGGIAWTEMSRGLLVYAVRLARRSAGWVVERCRVIAPTEWNFHPEGGLARALQAPVVTSTLQAPVVTSTLRAPVLRSTLQAPVVMSTLQAPGLALDCVRAAVSALDPCVEFSLPTTDAGAAHA
jgi:hypothetical protein